MARRSNSDFNNMSPGEDTPINCAVSGRDRATLSMVSKAIAHKETLLAFQPVIHPDNPESPAFYEGLIRVLDNTGRVIPAKDFMAVVEETSLGRKLDCLALEMGLRTLARNPALRLSINMSARSIGFQRWMRILDRGLNRNPTLGERLILEITEASAMMVPELVISFMQRLQSKGISFALDDFGAGFTAFRYFKEFYFDIVKIDGQFIRGIAQDTDNQILVRALTSIAEQFDMISVAEHVECAEDAAVLVELGVDCMQGFYFGASTTKPPWQVARHSHPAVRASV